MQKNLIKIASSILAAATLVSLVGCMGQGQLPEMGEDDKLCIQVLIDGRDILYLKGDKIWIQHEAYDMPGKWAGQDLPVTIYTDRDRNSRSDRRPGQKWKLKWNGNLTQQETIENGTPIPNYGEWDEDNFKVEIRTIGYGRGKVQHYPNAVNDYTLVIELDDIEPDGAHWFGIYINWTEDEDKRAAAEQ